jgi:TonB family protein
MIDGNLLSNLVSYSAQIACVAGVGGLMLMALHVDTAAVRHALWRSLLAFCVALPWVQGRTTLVRARDVALVAASLSGSVDVSGMSTAAAPRAGVPWLALLGVLLVGGIVVRLLWLGIGLVRLRRLRTAGEVATAEGDDAELQRLLGTRAQVRFVPGLGQPVTFGVRRAIVLLPDTLRDHSPEIQRAVLCHELIHVQRHDWIWVLVEEVVRAVFWFHPAIWWLISRVQLTREETVDELTVMATSGRRAYIEALLAFGDQKPLAPVAAFGRTRHLFRRVVLLSKEAGMSSRRVMLSCFVVALVVMAGSWYAVGAFPLIQGIQAPPSSLVRAVDRLRETQAAPAQATNNGPGPLEARAKPITPENPVPRRLYAVMPLYPADAPADRPNVTISLRVTLDGSGRVAEVRALNGAVGSRAADAIQGRGGRGRGSALSSPTVVGPSTAGTGAFTSVFSRAANDAIRQWVYEPPADGPIAFEVTISFSPDSEAQLVSHGGLFGGVLAGRRLAAGPPPPASPPPPPPPGTSPESQSRESDVVRVGGGILVPAKVKDVPPVYPPIAESARVQGVVILEVRVGPDGRVADARVLRSIPLLDQAAIDAVLQWEYTPTLLNGSPVSVLMTVTVNFTLQ